MFVVAIRLDAHMRGEMGQFDGTQGDLSTPDGFQVNVKLQPVGMKKGRSPGRLASMQGEPVELSAQMPPLEMEISKLDARSGGVLKLLDILAASPTIRKAG